MKDHILRSGIVAATLFVLSVATVGAQSAHQVVVGEGATVRLALQTPLSSKLNEVGDPVRAVLYDDLYVDGHLVLKRGTEFLGRVTHVKPARRGQRQAEMAVVFDRVKTSYGLEEIATRITAIDDYARDRKLKGDGEGVVRGGHSAGRTAGNVLRGARLGAYGGTAAILIGQSRGAARAGGIAIVGGMAGGLLLTKGSEIRLSPGTILRVRFERPIALPVMDRSGESEIGNR